MTYQLRFTRSAETYLLRLERPTQERIAVKLRALTENPFGAGSKPLTNAGGLRATRVGLWRVIYGVENELRVVHIEVIGPRGQAYRGL